MQTRVPAVIISALLVLGFVTGPVQAAPASGTAAASTVVKPGALCKKSQSGKKVTSATYGTLQCKKRKGTYRWVVVAPPAQAPATKAAEQWIGAWDTTSGPLTLTKVDASTVTGTFGYQSGLIPSATASGNVLSGRWSVGSAPGPDDQGTFTWTISADGQGFTGTFTTDAGRSGEWLGGRP